MSRTRTKITLALAVLVAAAGVVVGLRVSSDMSSGRYGASGTTTTVPDTSPRSSTTTTTMPTTTTTIDCHCLSMGESGPAVTSLQQRLTDLGYWLGPVNGSFGITTEQAVMAFQKTVGLDRDGSAGPITMAALATATRPAPRTGADGIDVDLAKQTLTVVQGGQVLWVFNTSTGKPSTPTAPGDFTVYRQVDAMDHAPDGDLWRPKYFDAGDAIHGSPSIPGYAASHGCSRLTNAAMDFLWSANLLPIGTPVRVH